MMTMNMFTWTRKKLPKEHFYSEPVSSRVSSLLVSLIALIMELLLARKDKKNLQQSEIWLPIYKNLILLLYLEKINVFLCYESINIFSLVFGVSYTVATMKTTVLKSLIYPLFLNLEMNERIQLILLNKNYLKFKSNPKNIQQQH